MTKDTRVMVLRRSLVILTSVGGWLCLDLFAGSSSVADSGAFLPIGPLEQLWSLMFSLEDPVGRFINQTILALFGIAVLELVLATLRTIWNGFFLKRAQHRLKAAGSDATLSSTLEDFLQLLGLGEKWLLQSLVAQRVRNLFRLRAKGSLDVAVLKEITGERVGLQGGFSRFMAGSLTVLGLVGTVLGLSLAIGNLAPTLGGIESTRDIGAFAKQMLTTLAGMKTAFSCTLTGLICAFILSTLNFCVQRVQAGFYGRLEEFSNYELVPLIAPASADHATDEFVQKIETAGQTISNALERVDAATRQYVDSASAVKSATEDLARASQNVGGAVEGMRDGGLLLMGRFEGAAGLLRGASEQFVSASQAVTEQNAQQTEQWATVAQQLRTTSDAFQGQVGQMAKTAQALHEGTVALQAIRDLPSSFQQVLAEAMQGAVQSAQQHQDTLTTEYLRRIDEFLRGLTGQQQEFQQSYADLVLGVQQSVAQLMSGFGGRQEEMVAELRSLNSKTSKAAQVEIVAELHSFLKQEVGRRQEDMLAELRLLNKRMSQMDSPSAYVSELRRGSGGQDGTRSWFTKRTTPASEVPISPESAPEPSSAQATLGPGAVRPQSALLPEQAASDRQYDPMLDGTSPQRARIQEARPPLGGPRRLPDTTARTSDEPPWQEAMDLIDKRTTSRSQPQPPPKPQSRSWWRPFRRS
jgi:hypothetical protein